MGLEMGRAYAELARQERIERGEPDPATQPPADKILQRKMIMLEKRLEAEKAAYAYFTECDIGLEREQAYNIYENIRNATRL